MKRICMTMMVAVFAFCMMIVMVPAEASAASGVYVPVGGTATQVIDGKKDTFTIQCKYDKSGRILSRVETWPGYDNWSYSRTFVWDKNLLASLTSTTTDEGTDTETHTYENGCETRYLANQSSGDTYDTVYAWDETGRTAAITQTFTGSGGGVGVITGTRKLDEEKRIVEEIFSSGRKSSKVTYTYYKNGKKKSSREQIYER